MKIAKGYHGCSDGGCVFGHPGGMHTNGGCKCLPISRPNYTVDAKFKLRKQITSLRQERDLLLYALEDMLSSHNNCGCLECRAIILAFTENK